MNHYEGSKLVSLLLSERSKGLSQAYGEGVGSLIEVSKWVALASLSLSVSQNPLRPLIDRIISYIMRCLSASHMNRRKLISLTPKIEARA